MHECRHTFASLLIDTGEPKAIQEVMGHSNLWNRELASKLVV